MSYKFTNFKKFIEDLNPVIAGTTTKLDPKIQNNLANVIKMQLARTPNKPIADIIKGAIPDLVKQGADINQLLKISPDHVIPPGNSAVKPRGIM